MSEKKLKKEDFILYILNKLEPEKSDKIRLNKLAFFVEFAYLLKFKRDLSTAEYAAIDMGPVINDYEAILKDMQKRGLVAVDGYVVRPLKSPVAEIPAETKAFIDGIMDKYSKLPKNALIGLSHLTDAYKITTNNERVMGKRIDKKLAALETFLIEDEHNGGVSEDELPSIDRSQLVPYAR